MNGMGVGGGGWPGGGWGVEQLTRKSSSLMMDDG